jgi:ribosomal protein S18 acetylase RimI-like enzyme
VTCIDWRDAPAAEIESLYAREASAWLSELHWDVSESMAIVEQARRAGRLPGCLARYAGGRIAGWAFYVVHDGWLQIGGLTADAPATTRRLLNAVLESPEAALAQGLSCFVRGSAPGLDSALDRLRFARHESQYLVRRLAPALAAPRVRYRVRLLRDTDLLSAVHLLSAAYEGTSAGRCFAPAGTREQWVHYLGQLLCTPACGRLWEPGTLVAEDPATGQLAAVLVCTVLSAGTLHVAQIAVAPAFRRLGVAGALLARAFDAAAGEGFERVTLIVDGANGPAMACYAGLGFERRGRFVFAHRGPRRTSQARRALSRAC